MSERASDRVGRALLVTPSFYALAAFVPAWLGYLSDLIPWNPASWLAHATFAIFVFALVVATAIQVDAYRRRPVLIASVPVGRAAVLALTAAGLLGCGLYLRDMAAKLGGLGVLVVLYGGDPLAVREAQRDFSSLGTQLSYAGWIGAGLAAVRLGQRRGGVLDVVAIVAQLLANLVFVDRTRPIWVAFTCLLLYVVCRRDVSFRAVMRTLAMVTVIGAAFFVAFSVTTGKVVEERGSVLESAAFSLVYYATNALPYLAFLIDREPELHPYLPESTLSPLFQALAAVGVVESPPQRILPFFNVPFSTNVGTGLQPFFSDGGFPFLAIGILAYSFGLNAAGAWLLRRGGPLGAIAWAHVCFTAFICFFTPKINNPPFWIMVGVGVVGVLLARREAAIPGGAR